MPNETPKLDRLYKKLQFGKVRDDKITQSEILDCLMEIRSLLKVARIGATNVPREGT